MLATPTTIVVTLSSVSGGPYRAHIVGWGLPDRGSYSSLWCRDLDLDVEADSAPAVVLGALSDCLAGMLPAAVTEGR